MQRNSKPQPISDQMNHIVPGDMSTLMTTSTNITAG
jgi:hypothetical protein